MFDFIQFIDNLINGIPGLIKLLKWLSKYIEIIILIILFANTIAFPIIYRPWGWIFGILNGIVFIVLLVKVLNTYLFET
jgi:hypothetical protein